MAEPMQLVRVRMILAMCYLLLFHPSWTAPAGPSSPALPPTPAGTLCIPSERDALLDFKAGLTDPTNLLSSWRGAECCRWTGVVCSNRTGRIVTLQVKSDWAIGGEIRSSVLTLRHLKQLNLSGNDFGLKHIPEFMGALGSGHLTHLDLSYSNFSGRIPPHLGNLSDLANLRLNSIADGFYSRDLTWVSGLRKLQVLGMSGVDLSAAIDWTHAINMLPYLIDLDFSFCGLKNSMPPPVHSNLTSLETLTADALGNLTSVKKINLEGNNFTTMLPLTFKKMKKLQELILPYNFIHMDVAELMDRLPSDELQLLDLGDNYLTGSLPTWLGNFSSIKEIDLSYNELSGEILTVDALGNLTSIQEIDLSGNNFTRTLLLTFKKMQKLQQLRLADNFIHMDVAELMDRLPSDELQLLDLGGNYLTGSLPTWLGNFSRLNEIGLYHNELSGEIPVGIRELKNLRSLWLASNNLHGTITEDHFTNLTTLEDLDISDNSLTMKVDGTWRPPFSLSWAGFGSCILGPQFPTWLNQSSIFYLDVSNTSIHGDIPAWIANSSATYLDLSRNRLVGMLPTFSLSSPLTTLKVSSNQIVGPIPKLPKNLLHLDLSGNNISGTLPSPNLGSPMLEVLLLYNNSFSGTIPCSLLQLQQLVFLDLSKNLLNGTFPNCPRGFKTSNITLLNLNKNSLSGAFPLFLQRCRELKFLDLGYNKFSGSLPTWIGSKLPHLALLRLRSNMFSGGIPGQLTRMKGLQFLDIACNNISGNIPPSLGDLIAMTTFTSSNSGGLFDVFDFKIDGSTMSYIYPYSNSIFVDVKGQHLEYTKGIAYMVNIDFSCNSLTGKIPQEIGKLVALKNLNLSWNSLTGIIPQRIGELQTLESLDLSHNELSGEIPTSLSTLTSLSRLNLSYNDLTGTIPSGNQLRALDDQASIYIGNLGLCGPPVPRNCSRTDIIPYAPQDHDEGISDVVSLYLSICIGFVVGLWAVFCGFLFKRKWRVCWFSFTDHIYDRAYVQVAVGWASLARKIRHG